VALGSLAGLGFSAAAIASRPLAGHGSALAFVSDPLLYIVIVNSIVGQVLLAAAMQRGSTTAAVSSMEAATAVPAAFFGVVLLGDKIAPGRGWLAILGFVVTLAAVLLMTRFASEQHGGAPGDYPLQIRPRRRHVPIKNSRWVAPPRRSNARRTYKRGRRVL
jgi:drug/metabolite transporter (DMT)-like permease